MWVDLAHDTADGTCVMVDRRGAMDGLCYLIGANDPLLQSELVEGLEDVTSRMWFLCTQPGEGERCTSTPVPESMMPAWCQADGCGVEDLFLCSMSR